MTELIGTFNISLPGTSHERLQIPCQDSSVVETLKNGWIIAAIADGLGSAAHSDIGSAEAVKAVVETFKNAKLSAWDEKDIKSVFLSSYHTALQTISDIAHKEGNPESDYDTTLTSLLYNGDQAFFLHVGDGGIITLTKDGEFSIITSAQKGNSFNEVVPLRAGESHWQFGVSGTGVCSLLMMTDGIFDMACPPIYAHFNQPIRINYVRQFMDISFMRSHGHHLETEEDFQTLKAKLAGFYRSPGGTSGITDDKTILGIINTSPEYLPKERDPEYYKEPDISTLIEEQNKRLYENKEREAEVARNRYAIENRERRSRPMPVPATASRMVPSADIKIHSRIVDYRIQNNRITRRMKLTVIKVRLYERNKNRRL